jgi:hypothetical protein
METELNGGRGTLASICEALSSIPSITHKTKQRPYLYPTPESLSRVSEKQGTALVLDFCECVCVCVCVALEFELRVSCLPVGTLPLEPLHQPFFCDGVF